MRPATTIACVVALVCTSSRLLGQTGDGYVGVFGDAAGTIRCMQAPPGVPTTLYVVAKAAGATANGITGAEFRIEFVNPTGYLMMYTAPDSALTLGDPLSGTGFNIAFSRCRTPVAGIVSVGRIAVFNTGSGGQTDIIVKRRNPPTNANYPCALFTQCDAGFTKACMTAPAESVSCLTQKAGVRVPSGDDEFTTSLDGSTAASSSDYVGYQLLESAGYEGSFSKIEHVNPSAQRLVKGLSAWVGIDNGDSVNTVWLQAGWRKYVGYMDVRMYWEYTDENRVWSTPNEVGSPGSGDTDYEVRKNGNNAEILVAGVNKTPGLSWNNFDGNPNGTMKLWVAWFGVELHGGTGDYVPGSPGAECHFKNAALKKLGGSNEPPAFVDQCKRNDRANANGHVEARSGDGGFYVWDDRP